MNFTKIRKLVNNSIYLDLKTADVHKLRVNYDTNDENAWFDISPEKFGKEEDLAAIINAKAEIKRQSKAGSAFGNKKIVS
ncbi:MAG TPA: hypothetical protein VG965_00400 [Patescibacteria group bacterium]|nr:hypothetical protein [Patescibacteria group bacterium]